MSKSIKAMFSVEYRNRYSSVESACVVDLSGMTVKEQGILRTSLRERSARMQVVKNRLIRLALGDGPLKPLGDALEGPCALVTTSESLIDVAKTLVEAAKEFDKLTLKHAILDGDPTLLTVEELSRFKSKAEMLGEVAMLVSSPGRAIVGCIGSPQSKIVGCLKAIVEKAA